MLFASLKDDEEQPCYGAAEQEPVAHARPVDEVLQADSVPAQEVRELHRPEFGPEAVGAVPPVLPVQQPPLYGPAQAPLLRVKLREPVLGQQPRAGPPIQPQALSVPTPQRLQEARVVTAPP